MDRMREKVGLKVVKALKRNDVGVTHAALDMLCALMQVNSSVIKDYRTDCTSSSRLVESGLSLCLEVTSQSGIHISQVLLLLFRSYHIFICCFLFPFFF